MGKEAKQGLIIFGLVIGVLIVGRLVYTRVAPDPETQRLNDSADKINKQLEEIRKLSPSPSPSPQ